MPGEKDTREHSDGEDKREAGFKEMPSLDESQGSDEGMELTKPLTYDQLRQKAINFLVISILLTNRRKSQKRVRSRQRPRANGAKSKSRIFPV